MSLPSPRPIKIIGPDDGRWKTLLYSWPVTLIGIVGVFGAVTAIAWSCSG